jgi:hypothetical protein
LASHVSPVDEEEDDSHGDDQEGAEKTDEERSEGGERC